MAMTTSVSKLQKRLSSASTRLANLGKAARDPAKKLMSTAITAGGGAGTGALTKWARENSKDMTIGDSKVTYQAVAGATMAIGGAIAGGASGWKEVAYAAHSLGNGIVAGELALMTAS